MKVSTEQIENGRRLYSEFLRGMSGGFYTSLFQTIAKAKNENVYKMAEGFGGEVYAYQEYIGSLDPYAWDIEGETSKEKFTRLTAKREQDEDFYKKWYPFAVEDLQAFNIILDAVSGNGKGKS